MHNQNNSNKRKSILTKEELAKKGFGRSIDMTRFQIDDFYLEDGETFDKNMASHPAFRFFATLLSEKKRRGVDFEVGKDEDGALIICMPTSKNKAKA